MLIILLFKMLLRRQSNGVSSPLQVFDWQEEHIWVDGRGEVKGRSQPIAPPTGLRELDLEPVDYDLDISKEVGGCSGGARPLGAP